MFRNFYRCPRCQHEWQDEWECQCDDDCPACGARHVSPYKSDDAPPHHASLKGASAEEVPAPDPGKGSIEPNRPRYTHDFQLIFAVANESPDDATNEEVWQALNERMAELRQAPKSLISEVWPPIQTIDNQDQ